MRDRRFVAVHRGGPLDRERHRLLAVWAAECAEHLAQCHEDVRHVGQAVLFAYNTCRWPRMVMSWRWAWEQIERQN